MKILGININDLVVWSYFLIGGLFIFYWLLVFIQREISNRIRLGLSTLFLTIGFFFMNAAGKILSGHNFEFTLLTLVNSMLLAGVGLICVYIIYRENEKNKKRHENHK